MSLGPLMVDIAGTELSAEDARVLAHPLVGSVLLFTRNYRNPWPVADLTAAHTRVRRRGVGANSPLWSRICGPTARSLTIMSLESWRPMWCFRPWMHCPPAC